MRVEQRAYGHPPDAKDCTEIPSPGFRTTLDPEALNPGSTLFEDLMGSKVPPVAIARQLIRKFPKKNVLVKVTGYGTFRVGPQGWVVE